MKRNFLKIIPFLLLGGALGLTAAPSAFESIGVKAEDTTVVEIAGSEFAGQGDSPSGKSCSVKKEGVRIHTTNGYGTGGALRIYSGKDLEIDSDNYNIKKVELTMSDSGYIGLNSVYDDVNSKSFSATTSKQTRISKFKVTLSVEGVKISSLSIDTSKATTSFVKDDEFDNSGVKVNGNVVGGGTVDLTSSCTFSPANGTKLTETGYQNVTVTYPGGGTPDTETGSDVSETYQIFVDDEIKTDSYKLVTSMSQIKANDEVILVSGSGDTAKAMSTLGVNSGNTEWYFNDTNVSIVGDELVIPSEAEIYPIKLGISSTNWTLYSTEHEGLIGAKKAGRFSFANDATKTWNISFDGSNCEIENTDTSYGKFQYNGSGSGYFANYATSQSPVSLFKKTSSGKNIYLSHSSLDMFTEQVSTISVVDYEGFTPSSYAWSIVEGSEFISLGSDLNKSNVQVTANAVGTAKIQVIANSDPTIVAYCYINVKAASESVLAEGDYFVVDGTGSHQMDKNYLDQSVDLVTASNLWTVSYAGQGENTYYIHNSSGYLVRKNPISGGQATALLLHSDPAEYWTLSGNKTDGFYAQCSSNDAYLAPGDDGQWRAISTKTKINFVQGLTFDSITPVGTPTQTTYNVGETFNPAGLTFQINFTDGPSMAYTGAITWDPLVKGTTVTGRTMYGGVERVVTVTGLTITNYQATSLALSGTYKTEYYVGENVDITGLVVTAHMEDDTLSKDVVLDAEDYDYLPKIVANSTTEITIIYNKDKSITKTFAISKNAKTYYTTNYVTAGEKILLAWMNSDTYNIKGGEEFCFDGSKPSHASYDYSPNGVEEFLVENTSYVHPDDSSIKGFALKNTVTGKYLRSNGSKFEYYKDTSITCGYDAGKYDFSYYAKNVEGVDMYLNLVDGEIQGDGSVTGFWGFDYFPGSYSNYVTSECLLLNDGTGLITYKIYTASNGYSGEEVNVDVTWTNDGGIEITIPGSGPEETITDNAVFFLQYVKTTEEWNIQSYKDTTKYLSYNSDGDGNFNFYSSRFNDVCVYRRNDAYLPSKVTSINVNEESITTTYNVGDKFSWTGLQVTAHYEGGASSVLPLGSYDITMPDMNTAGTYDLTVSYGALDNVKTDTLTVTVKEPTPVVPTVVSVEITTPATKLEYHLGETIVFDGVLTATMSDGTTQPVAAEDIKLDKTTASSLGSMKISVSYKGNSSIQDQYYITVVAAPKTLQSITVSGQKTEFNINDEFEFGGTVTAHYSDGSNKIVVASRFSAVDMTTVGKKTVTVEYDEDVTVSTTYEINVTKPKEIVSFEIKPAKVDFSQGEAFSSEGLVVTVHYDDGSKTTDYPFNVDSSAYNKDVLGEYDIVVTIPGFAGEQSYKVTVNKIVINTIELRYTSSKEDAKPGDTQQIMFKKPDPTGEFFSYDDFTYESSNENIAEVQMIGGVPTIVYKDYGKCTVTVKAKVGTGVATYQVNVLKHVTGISVEDSADVNINETVALHAVITPEDADNKNVTWSSSDTKIATVDANGVVTGLKEGEVVITVTANDKVLGKFSASCTVHVHKVPVTGITLNETEKTLNIGDTFNLVATITPDNATYKGVKWSSSMESVAKVDSNGKVTAVGAGKTTITAVTEDGAKIATCVITVTSIPVENVSLNETSKEMNVNDTFTLVATVTPDNATNKKVEFTSSNTAVATVDSNGKVTAIAEGEATITVRTLDGDKTATCVIKVKGSGSDKKDNTGVIVGASVGGAAAVGIGCGVFIPLGLRRRRRIIK